MGYRIWVLQFIVVTLQLRPSLFLVRTVPGFAPTFHRIEAIMIVGSVHMFVSPLGLGKYLRQSILTVHVCSSYVL